MTGFRKLLFNVHLWVGIAACLLLVVLGVTGALLAFEPQIDHLLNRSVAYVTPQEHRVSLDAMAQSVKQAYPKARIGGVELGAAVYSPDLAYTFSVVDGKSRLQVYVDPYNGKVLGARTSPSGFMYKVHQLHTNLLGGVALRLVTTWGTILLALLALTGIYLWWPRKIFGAKFDRGFRRANFDLHNSIGLYASVFVLLFALTAVVIHWEEGSIPVASFILAAQVPAQDATYTSAPAPAGTPQASLESIFEAAKARMPGARVTQISVATKPKDFVRVWMKYPEDSAGAGRSMIFLDQYTSQVLWSRASREAPRGWRYVKEWNREIHTGSIYGMTSEIIASLASLSVVFLAISGPLIWWLKLKKNKQSTPVVAIREEELEEALA